MQFPTLSRLLLALLVVAGPACHAASEHPHDESPAFQRCVGSAARTDELRASDAVRAAAAASAPAPVPAGVHQLLSRLLKSARLPQGMQVKLHGVRDGRSASVMSSGTIFLGSRLWAGDGALSESELAAALAHEIAHLEAADVQQRLCDAVASSGDETLALAAATGATHRLISTGRDDVAVRMMQRNHLRELRADGRGARLLQAAGFQAGAMATMLLKVTVNGRGGSSGSHPAIETRLENLGVSLQQVVAGR